MLNASFFYLISSRQARTDKSLNLIGKRSKLNTRLTSIKRVSLIKHNKNTTFLIPLI